MVWCCTPFDPLCSSELSSGIVKGSRLPNPLLPINHAPGPIAQSDGREDLVSVTVPVGMIPGQTITVLAPDGSRTVKASIPDGLVPGDSFLVRLAKTKGQIRTADGGAALHIPEPKFGNALDAWLKPTDGDPDDIVETRQGLDECKSPTFVEALTELLNPSLVEPSITSKTRQTSTNNNKTTTSNRKSSSTSSPSRQQQQQKPEQLAKQKLLLVDVPSGMTAGQLMQVEVPGEDRTLEVQIPPNVEQFHVSYTPRLQPAVRTMSSPQPPQPLALLNTTITPPSPMNYNSTNSNEGMSSIMRQQSPTGQKLLLVRVPVGTPAGTTLHVSVPDEPGRILAAQVPPGNVTEFHVSYEARPPIIVPSPQATTTTAKTAASNNTTTTNNNTIASQQRRQKTKEQQHHQQHQQQQTYSNNNTNHGVSSSGSRMSGRNHNHEEQQEYRDDQYYSENNNDGSVPSFS